VYSTTETATRYVLGSDNDLPAELKRGSLQYKSVWWIDREPRAEPEGRPGGSGKALKGILKAL